MTAAAIPIYTGNDMYVPVFRVQVRQQDVPAVVARDIISLTYRDSLDTFDSVELVLNNWDDSRSALPTQFTYCVDAAAPYADLFAFDRSRRIDVALGYEGVKVVSVFSGTVETVEPHYPASGAPSITVRLINPLKALADKQRTRTYVDKSTADIAREIARDNALDIVIETHRDDDDQPQPYTFQDNQHDIVFLMQRARRIGYDVWLEGDKTLHVGPASAGNGGNTVYKLGFHRSMMDFEPRLTMTDQVGSVKVTARDQQHKATFSATASRAEVGLNADLEGFVTDEIRNKVKTVTNQPLHANGQAKQLAREIMRNIMQQMLTATINAPGLPDLRAGRLVEITDVGGRFAGPYLVTSSTHTIDDSGYRTSFSARRESYG
jgi:phage protein D